MTEKPEKTEGAPPPPSTQLVGDREWPRNPFKRDILKKQFAACVYCYFSRDKDFFRADGSRHTGNGVANAFWKGFDGVYKPGHWDGSKDTPAYASYRAGEMIAAYERSITPAPQTNVVGSDEPEFNVWKAKAISRGKLLERFRDLIMNMADHVEHQGDRVYFGSTNDYDDLREIGQQMDMWKWDRIIRERPERDPYADCRELRARIAELEAQHMTSALAAIAAERQRQVAKGYDAAHDDAHVAGDIINSSWGASARIYAAQDRGMSGDVEGYKRYLIQAAAQIVAEVERVDRAARATTEGSDRG